MGEQRQGSGRRRGTNRADCQPVQSGHKSPLFFF